MSRVLAFGPLRTQARFGRTSIRPASPVQRTENPSVFEISTRRNHLSTERVRGLPADFAEIRALPGSDQVLEMPVPLRAENLDLKVAAAGRADSVVRRLAAGCGARRLGHAEHRKLASRLGRPLERERYRLAVLNHDETIIAELSGLSATARLGQRRPVAMSSATDLPIIDLGVTAGNFDPDASPQFGAEPEQGPECDSLGVPVEPGGLRVHRARSPGIVVIGDSKGDRQAEAVRSSAFALGDEWHGAET
mgnify:CR=1 FL=1